MFTKICGMTVYVWDLATNAFNYLFPLVDNNCPVCGKGLIFQAPSVHLCNVSSDEE